MIAQIAPGARPTWDCSRRVTLVGASASLWRSLLNPGTVDVDGAAVTSRRLALDSGMTGVILMI